MTIAQLIPAAIGASTVLTVLSIGLTARIAEVTSLLRAPTRLARALLAMLVIVPLFAMLVARQLQLEPAVKIALGALALSPVPPVWPGKAMKAGGEASYTLGLFVATTLLSPLLIPASLVFFRWRFELPLHLAPSTVAKIVFMTVLLPLCLGIVVRAVAPRVALRLASPLGRAGTLVLVAGALPILFTSWRAITSLVGDGTLLTMIAFVLVGLLAGNLLGGPDRNGRNVLGLACALRHPGVAVAIAMANFPTQKLVLPAILLYTLVSSAAAGPYLRWSRRHSEGHRPAVALR